MSPNIYPRNYRILHAIRTSLASIADRETLSRMSAAQFKQIDKLINELMLRADAAPYAALYKQLGLLLKEAKGAPWADRAPLTGGIVGITDLLEELDVGLSSDAYGEQLGEAFRRLSNLTARAINIPDPQVRNFAECAVNLELELYRLRARAAAPVKATSAVGNIDLSAQSLSNYLVRRVPHRSGDVSDIRVIPGGFQKVTAMFDVRGSDGEVETLVIRADKFDKFGRFDANWVTAEYDIVRYIHDLGVPSAKPYWLEANASELGAPFMITSKVSGSAMPVTGLSAGPSPASIIGPEGVRSIMETLAFLHSLPVEGLAETCIGHWLDDASLAANTAKAVRLYEEQPFWWPAETSPTLSAAMSWLKAHVPQDDARLSILHVDYGVHNLMMENNRVAAVLDWENARIGDPAEDITFALSSLGPDVDREQALTWYKEAGGEAISLNRLRFFDVYNMMKVASSGVFSAGLLEEDGNAALEWCALALNMVGGCAGSMMTAIRMAEEC